jgi:hypothetical protein
MLCLVSVLMLGFSVNVLVALAIDLSLNWPPAEYSAALAVAPGNKPAPTVVPAPFNLTVHIKNPSRLYSYCVWSDAAAVVTYGGATIGAGTVPWLCAGKVEEREVAVPVWGAGAGADVTLPGALQSRGEAVDVVLRVPRSPACSSRAQVQVLACSVKVGMFAFLIGHQPAVLFTQNKLATSNLSAVFFSQNKSAPAISHLTNEQAVVRNRMLVSLRGGGGELGN